LKTNLKNHTFLGVGEERRSDERRGDAELDPYVTPPVYPSTP
jgi:hypothetical protein